MPGRDGLQGLKGSGGTKGAKGDKGAIGLMGPKGSLGEQGPIGVGQRGIKGEKGVKGEPGPQEESDNASINWKQCVWKRDDNQDTGLLQVPGLLKDFILIVMINFAPLGMPFHKTSLVYRSQSSICRQYESRMFWGVLRTMVHHF